MLERSPKPVVEKPTLHESAALHVTGTATYIDDLPEPRGTLHLAPGLTRIAHGRLVSMDLSAVRAAPGVITVLTAADIPGQNDTSPIGAHDEPLFVTDSITSEGQILFVVAAETRAQARAAVRRAVVETETLDPILDIDTAREARAPCAVPGRTMTRGDAEAAIAAAPRRLSGRIVMGGQEHFYLEGQAALALPGEGPEMIVWSSTQHPTETQAMVAHLLDVPANAITASVRRMGGGFGGKETQANQTACLAALVAHHTRRPARLRLDRDDDMVMTGKRHDFAIDYTVGFDDDGKIHGVDMLLACRCGWSADLSGPVIDRALTHADNAYFYPAVRLRSLPLRTNTVSNTAFRGFGVPQGALAAERVIEEIAFATGLEPNTVRLRNVYENGQLTPYHMTVEDSITAAILTDLARRCEYDTRKAALRASNAKAAEEGRVLRRGIAMTPVKFGISFTATHYNQAGALVHVYTDGSVQINHGGTEMGQGLHTKMMQVAARVFGLPQSDIRLTATTTDKVPNTSATAASSGADLNGMAVLDAATKIRDRIRDFAAERYNADPGTIRFHNSEIHMETGQGTLVESFAAVVRQAYLARVSLSSSGFYKTPEISWDPATGRGHPFYYFAYGAACAEIVIDTLTGEYRIDRVDILHDAGLSLNPEIDRGQIEGGFVQGAGWLTMEELVWDKKGALRTHAPSTYKIPTAFDMPRVFNVALLEDAPNRKATIFRSKAVGEPPFALAACVLFALSDAVASLDDYRTCPRLDAPATPETVLACIERLRAGKSATGHGTKIEVPATDADPVRDPVG
jgi:xanthine dehydrogenase large subunit